MDVSVDLIAEQDALDTVVVRGLASASLDAMSALAESAIEPRSRLGADGH